MILFEYVDSAGRGAMTNWVKTKEVREFSGAIDQALDRLEQAGSTMPGFFVGPLASHRHVYKLRLGGKVRLRPLLCKGPAIPIGS
jgi:hypothetical protein